MRSSWIVRLENGGDVRMCSPIPALTLIVVTLESAKGGKFGLRMPIVSGDSSSQTAWDNSLDDMAYLKSKVVGRSEADQI